MKSSLKWKRATPIYPSDHIVSSKARELGIYGFKPEYEENKHINIRFILSNEYMRLWFKERQLYQKENYSKQENARNDSHIKRGYVQRMMTNPKLENRELPIIQLKRFQNIMSKVDNRRTQEEKAKICSRFKKTVEPVELTRFKPACATVKPKSGNVQKVTSEKVSPSASPKKKQDEAEEKASVKEKGNESGKRPGCGLVCKVVN